MTHEPVADDLGKRRDRTYTYLRLWGIDTDLTVLPIVRAPAIIPSSAAVCGRATASSLVALKGQGLSLPEVFAFADAYEVWGELTLDEHDFILDDAPPPEQLVQFAWHFDQAFVFEWALRLVPHLRFPDASADSGRVMEQLMTQVLTVEAGKHPSVRTAKELADAADVAFALQAIALAAVTEPPLGIVRSVTIERAAAFEWLLSAPDSATER